MENNDLKKYTDSLLEKSIEAYFMAVEIINKPTIRYRTEGFCFFICNAWELLLKAWLINKHQDINAMYYNDKKTKKRSLSLHDCLKKFRTREKDPIRVNISFIADLRNTATHDIIPELDFQLSAFFQSCIEYYTMSLYSEFGISLAENGVENFISLASVPNTKITSTLFLNDDTESTIKSIMNTKNEKGIVEQNLTIVRSKSGINEDLSFRIANDGEVPIHIINQPKDVNALYPLTNKQIITKTKKLLASTYENPHFTTHTFLEFRRLYQVDSNTEYCYPVKYGNSTTYKYSEKLLTYISTTLINNTNDYNSILPKQKKIIKKEEVPGEADSR
ncbi:DUF3644 domain-containing protein [Erysipelothrix rhusiopathiae]|nr:DUF3644 domain-containing protein [Erysipelothrix rhusiopathiae]